MNPKDNNSSIVNIVIACDESYLPHAATMLCSLLENNKSPLKIFLLHNGIVRKKLKLLSRFVESYKSELLPIEIHDDVLSSLKITHHFSNVNYYRLLIPDIIPNEIMKVIYLDTDLLVRKPLDTLWSTELTGKFLAAVEEEISTNHKKELGLSLNYKYFNSGVMLIDVEKWRNESLHRKVIRFVKENPEKIEYVDQDGLNAILDGDWVELPMNWNVQSNYFLTPGSQIRFADIIINSNIAHFTGNGTKPWQYRKEPHPFFNEYDLYRKKTPWNKYKLDKPSMHVLKRRIFEIGKGIVHFLCRFDITFRINYFILCLAKKVDSLKPQKSKPLIHNEVYNTIDLLFPKRKVASGPFKGLFYPELKAIGSSIAPKLLGTYEMELWEIIEDICNTNYSTLIDIGCAEGYYACGFAMRIPKINVYAYDTNPDARELCKTMGNENGLADRIKIEEIFTMRTIERIPLQNQGIIVCDCEGAEEYIFYNDGNNWSNLIDNYDLLMEIHDVFRPGISAYIYDLFSESHIIQIIYSINDALRPKIFKNQLLNEKDNDTKVRLMAENRPGEMMWFYMKRKKNMNK